LPSLVFHRPFKRILVWPPRFLGDGLVVVPLLRQLKQTLGCDIELWVPSPLHPLLEGLPFIDKLRAEPKGIGAILSALREGSFEALINLRPSATPNLLAQAAGIPRRLGYRWQRWAKNRYLTTGFGLTDALDPISLETDRFQGQHWLDLLKALGATPNPAEVSLEVALSSEVRNSLADPLKALGVSLSESYAVVHWVAASEFKDVSPLVLKDALRQLQGQGIRLLATGLAKDSALVRQVQEATGVPLLNLAGVLSFAELAALLEKARLLITLDSAPLHLAAAVGTPATLAVFGPTHAAQWSPPQPKGSRLECVSLQLPCKPCMSKQCATNHCRSDLTAGHLLSALNRLGF
jgi:ADP-heptose:LPS heptosyltransferase